MGLTVEDTDGIRLITLDRPEVANAIDRATALELDAALVQLEADPALRAGVLTGGTRFFCSGKDLKAHARGEPEALIDDRGFAGLTRAHRTTPLVAAVEGAAVGGGVELALAADCVVASRTAYFAAVEVSRGLVPSEGGLVRLLDRLPRALVVELVLTGRRFSAEEAAQWGLVNRVVEPGSATVEAGELARDLVRGPVDAVRTALTVVARIAADAESAAFAAQDPLVEQLVRTGVSDVLLHERHDRC